MIVIVHYVQKEKLDEDRRSELSCRHFGLVVSDGFEKMVKRFEPWKMSMEFYESILDVCSSITLFKTFVFFYSQLD